MYRLIKLINDFKNYFIFVCLVIISLSLISMSSSSEIGGFRTIVITTVGTLQELLAWIPNPGALRSENRTLVELNLQLSTEVAKMRKALQENEELRIMLALAQTSPLSLIPVEVVQKSTAQMRNYVIINKGSTDSIKVGMAVRSAAGLIGSIIGSSKNYSIVELLNNRNINIPAKLLNSGHEGIISWEKEDYLLLKNISNSLEVEAGDVVITSTFSSKYPHNIPIGKVSKVQEEPGSHFKKIIITPSSNFFKFDQLFVINYIPDPQRQKLVKEIENNFKLLEQAGKK